MIQDDNKQNEDQEKLRIENELKKIKLSLDKGAKFSKTNENLTPEMEREFLKNIEMFEKEYDKAEQVTVYYFIGQPDYQKAESIPEDKIGDALDNIIKVLNENGIALDTLCDVEDRVLYTFITEELFLHEIDNVRIEGMVNHFIYEEFHPNHEYDIRNHSTDFFRDFLDKDSEFYTTFLTKEAEKDLTLIHFRDSFESFCLNNFIITSVTFDEIKANLSYKADFSATIENSHEMQHYKGEGKIELLYQYDFWCIHKVKFPPAL